jgi:ABC-type molybdate transport system permease subunit
MDKHQISRTAAVVLSLGISVVCAFELWTSGIPLAPMLAIFCVGFVGMMLHRALVLPPSEACDALLGFAVGVAGMLYILADRLSHVAEQARVCVP